MRFFIGHRKRTKKETANEYLAEEKGERTSVRKIRVFFSDITPRYLIKVTIDK